MLGMTLDTLDYDRRLLFSRPFPQLHPNTFQIEYKLYLSEVSTFSGGQYKLQIINAFCSESFL